MKRYAAILTIVILSGSSAGLFAQPAQKPAESFSNKAQFQISLKKVTQKLSRIKNTESDQFGNINDVNYLWLYGNRSNNLKAIVQAVNSTKRMTFPYSVPTPPDFTVGDLAFYLLCDWGYLDFEQIVSSLVGVESFRTNGYFAYFKWIKMPGNRSALVKILQEKLLMSDHQPNPALNSDAAATS